MTAADASSVPDDSRSPGKTRTWWHPLLARLLDYVLGSAYQVCEEVTVGKLPLSVDILLVRRDEGEIPEAGRRESEVLLPLLNRFTLIQFKGPTDVLERGDLAQLIGCTFLWHSQQAEPIPSRDVTLIVLAPSVTQAARTELRLLECEIGVDEAGIFAVTGLPFRTSLIETDAMAKRGEAILALVSRQFLRDRTYIMEQLTYTGHTALLCYALQQIRQFRRLGEDFAMQHKDSQYLDEVDEELERTILDTVSLERIAQRVAEDDDLQDMALSAIPPEKRVRGLPPEERMRGLPPEERVRGLSPEERISGLTVEQLALLLEHLERRPGG